MCCANSVSKIRVASHSMAVTTGHAIADINDQDKNGFFFVRKLSEAADTGGGFVRFIFNKPGAGDVDKIGYGEKIPGSPMWIGTGVYLANIYG